MLIVVT